MERKEKAGVAKKYVYYFGDGNAEGTSKMKELLAANAAEPAPYTPAQFKQHVADEIREWGKVVRAAGLKVE